MATLAVVEDFEVVERHRDEFDTALPAVPVEQLNLDAAPKVNHTGLLRGSADAEQG